MAPDSDLRTRNTAYACLSDLEQNARSFLKIALNHHKENQRFKLSNHYSHIAVLNSLISARLKSAMHDFGVVVLRGTNATPEQPAASGSA